MQEGAPTSEQLSSILEYLGPAKAASVVADATGTTDALKKFKASANAFQRPVTVDWMNGRAGEFSMLSYRDSTDVRGLTRPAVVGDNESEIMNLIRSLPKETEKA